MSQESHGPDSPPPPGEGERGDAAELRVRVAQLREEVDRLRGRIDREVYERKRAADQVAHLFRVSASVLVAPDLDEQLERVANGIVTACRSTMQ